MRPYIVSSTDKCQCNQVQAVSRSVQECLIVKFCEGGLERRNDDTAASWLKVLTMTAFAN